MVSSSTQADLHGSEPEAAVAELDACESACGHISTPAATWRRSWGLRDSVLRVLTRIGANLATVVKSTGSRASISGTRLSSQPLE